MPNETKPLDRILAALQNARRSGEGWSARCPAHEDRNSSLSVGTGEDGRVLLHCFAGCGADAIAGALGLTMRDLFPQGGRSAPVAAEERLTVERLAAAKGLPADFLRSLGVADRPYGVEIRYFLADKTPAPRWRQRIALVGKKRFLWSTGTERTVPYGLWRLGEAREAGDLILCEGESDCWTLWHHGHPALGIPGASMTGLLEASHLAGIPQLCVVQETDDAGARFVRDVARRLVAIDWKGDARLLKMFDGTKDLNDLHIQAGAKEFKTLLKNLLGEAARLGVPLEAVRSSTVLADASGTRDVWDPPTPFFTTNLPPFPVDALPDWLAEFVRAEAVATQVLPDLPGMLVLAVVAAACAHKIVILIKRGHIEPLNIFVVVALASGNRKSQNFRDLVRVIEEFEGVLARRLEPEIHAAETRHRVATKRLLEVERKASKAKAEDFEDLQKEAVRMQLELAQIRIPARPRLIVDDATVERIGQLLQEQEGRLAVMSPEGDIFDLLSGRYSSNGGANFGVFLRGHAGDSLRVDRISRPSDLVDRPALTVALAVQPDVIRGLAHTPGFRGRGLLARFLYAIPASLLGRRDTDPPPLPDDIRGAYCERMLNLLDLPFATDEEGNRVPWVLRLDDNADARMRAFAKWLEPRLGETGEFGAMTDWAGKLVGAVGRIAGGVHMALHAGKPAPWEVPVSGDTVRNAIRIGEYLTEHARTAFAEMGADPAVEDARYLLRWIERRRPTTFSRSEAYQDARRRFRKVDDMDPPLSILVSHGYIRDLPPARTDGPGRKPSPRYEVNPHALQGDSVDSLDSKDVPPAPEQSDSSALAEPALAAGLDPRTGNPRNPGNGADEPHEPASMAGKEG